MKAKTLLDEHIQKSILWMFFMTCLKSILRVCCFWMLTTIACYAETKIQISPISLTLSPSSSIQVINLSNIGKQPVSFQLTTVNSWQQLDGKNSYKLTQELAAMPPIMTILPGHKQVIRLGYIHHWAFKEEKAYRILLHQIIPPPKKNSISKMSLSLDIAFNISIPIFVTPNNSIQPNVTGTAHLKNSRLSVKLLNTGTKHIKVRDLDVLSDKGKILWRGSWMMYALAKGGEAVTRPVDIGSKSTPKIAVLTLDDNTKLRLPIS